MTYKEIVERLEDITQDMERLRQRQERDGMLDVDDETRWNGMVEEFDDLVARKYNLEKQADLDRIRAADIKARVTSEGAVVHDGGSDTRRVRTERGADNFDSDPLGEVDSISDVRGIRDPWDTSEIRLGMTPQAHAQEFRSRALTAIERMQGTNDKRRQTMTQLIERYDTVDARLSQQCLASSSPSYLRAFSKLARNQGKSETLNERERQAVERTMTLADTAGGYLVPFQLDPTVILTSDGSLNEMRQIARQVVATGDVWHGVSAGNVEWSFDPVAGQAPATDSSSDTDPGAVTEVSDDTPTFAQPTVTVKTARGFVPISLEAFMDESNVAAEVGRLLADGKDELESEAFIHGAGGWSPVGLITALSASAVAEMLSVHPTQFSLEDVYALHDALPARHRRRSSWLGNQSIYSLTRQFDEAGGSALWAQLGAARPQVLLGRPAYEAEPMDGSVTSGSDNYALVIGDFQHYVIADRIGMTVEFVPHLFGTAGTPTRRPTGARGWFAYYRVGANVVHEGAFRLLNINDST